MNGKDLFIGLSCIDRKFIAESDSNVFVSRAIAPMQPPKKKSRMGRLLLVAAILAAMLFLMGAALYTRWTNSMEFLYHPSESAKQQAEKSGLSVMYDEAQESQATSSSDGSILSATDQGITVSVVQTIVDPHIAHIILRVEGFQPPEDYRVVPTVWQDTPPTLGDTEVFWSSRGADFDNGILYQGSGKYTYLDGTPVEEKDGWQKGRYLRSDGSMELDVWYQLNSDAETLLGQEYRLHLTGFGIRTETGKADAAFEKLVEGHWDLKFPLKGSDEVKKYQLNKRLSDNVTLTEIEIGQLTAKALYKTDTYWDGWEKLESLTPSIQGIAQKDGTFIRLLPASEGYQDENAGIYFVEYRTFDGTVDLNQIESLAYGTGRKTDSGYQYIPVS